MTAWSPASDPPTPGCKTIGARFLTAFSLFVAAGVVAFAAALALLDRLDMLPPPPLTATSCIDEKFRFLAGRDLADVDLVAVGSSVTWRNLDMAAFRESGLAHQPMNAAPCYLHVGETAYLAAFLLDRLPQVRTVVTVLAPRDFETCSGGMDPFFSEGLAEAYLFHGLPPLPIYLSNFKPHRFLPDVFRIHRLRHDPDDPMSMVMDKDGSGPLLAGQPWLPAPAIAEPCFASLRAFERAVSAAGAKLVAVTMPLQPDWHRRYDPDRHLVDGFERRLREVLGDPSTTVVSGDSLGVPSLRHLDAVHFDWPSARRFTRALVDRLRHPPLQGTRATR